MSAGTLRRLHALGEAHFRLCLAWDRARHAGTVVVPTGHPVADRIARRVEAVDRRLGELEAQYADEATAYVKED